MGTAAADDRAAALNKIAAFSQAVSGLANQAAYDAYIADANNSAMIPTASDYNSAGVLGLTDSTEEITEPLATAINAKLFTGSADATVNTVEELQPYVDSANTIVDKIGAWAEPDWSGIGSVESFVSLIPSFENSSFDTVNGGDIQGWTKYIGVVNLGVTQLAGFTSPVESNTGADSSAAGGYLNDLSSWPTGGATVSVVSDPDDSGRGNVVRLDTGSNNITTAFGIEHGPAIYSNSAITLTAGATVTLDWKASAGGDAADVVGYLQNVNDGTTIKLLDYTSPSAGAETDWNSKSVTIPDGKEGDYKFVFVGGSFDFTGGRGVGAAFYIDNVEVRYITSPLKFNGLINSNGESDWQKAQALFDQLTYAENSAALAWTSDTVPTSVASVQVGWFDAGDTGVSTGVLDHFNLYPKNNGSGANAFDGLPSDFDILGWDNNADQWEIIKTFNLAAPTNVHSNSNALTYDVSDVSTKAYTGFKLDIRDTFGGGVVEMTEFDLQVRSVSVADLVSGSEPTYQEYTQVGVVGVDASNISDINALVFAKPSKSEVATIPLIQAIVDNYTASMSTIEAFTNSDGASDGNLNFTSDAGEAGVPTVSDYQAIGVRYIVNRDGLNIPISSSNIAAINEVLAQATYGDDQSDTVITTAAELRSVLNSDAVAARLTAIDMISKLATATESTLTLVDDATTPTVVSGDTVNLTLTGPYGSPEVLTATLSDIGGWVGIAAELTEDLPAYSGFTIVSTANGITITRADGANFSVAANDGTGTWTLTDSTNANSTLALSSNTASGTISVLGTGPQLTVADFAAAGVAGITNGNIEESVQTLIAKTTKSQIDTSLEITSSVNPPTQTITVDAISTDSGVTTDFITSDDDGLTVAATLSAALSAGQSLMSSNNNGTNFIDITSSVSGTAVSYDDSGLTSSDTIQMKIVDSIGQETTTVTQSVVIDTAAAAPTATTETINTNQSTSVTVAEAGTIYLVQHDATISSVNDITNLGDSHYNSVTATGAGSFDVSASGLTPDDYIAYFVDTAGNLSAFGANTVTVEAVPLELDVQLVGDTPVLSSKVIPVSNNGLDSTVLAEGDILRVSYSANGSSGVLIFPLSGGSLATAVDKFTDFSPTIVNGRYVELGGATINAADVIVVDGNHVSSATLESAYVSISNPPDHFYNKQIEYSLNGGTTWTSSGISGSGYLSSNYPYQKITFASPFTGTTILKIRLKGEPSSEWSETIIVDTTDPSAPTYTESGTVVTVTGEADADVYLIRDDGGTSAGSIKVDVINQIGTDDTAALQNLLAQDTHEWARGTIANGGTTGTIDTSGLMDGTYKLYQVDRAGNFSLVSTDGDLTISSSSVTDGDTSTHEYDVEFFSIDDGSTTHTDTASSVVSSGNNAVDLTFDLNDVTENDIVELYVDGQLAFSKEITASDKTTGSITTTDLNLDEKDVASGTSSSSVNATDNTVILELKVKHQGVYVQDGQDVTWDYQW